RVESPEVLARILDPAFGRWGPPLFIGSLFIACLGATLEIALECAYFLAQGFGWNWGKNQKPHDDARFSLAFTVILALAMLPSLLGADPLKITTIAMALTAATLPLSTIPFLILMN